MQLLNVTNGVTQVRPIIGALFEKYPTPQAMMEGTHTVSPWPAQVVGSSWNGA